MWERDGPTCKPSTGKSFASKWSEQNSNLCSMSGKSDPRIVLTRLSLFCNCNVFTAVLISLQNGLQVRSFIRSLCHVEAIFFSASSWSDINMFLSHELKKENRNIKKKKNFGPLLQKWYCLMMEWSWWSLFTSVNWSRKCVWTSKGLKWLRWSGFWLDYTAFQTVACKNNLLVFDVNTNATFNLVVQFCYVFFRMYTNCIKHFFIIPESILRYQMLNTFRLPRVNPLSVCPTTPIPNPAP